MLNWNSVPYFKAVLPLGDRHILSGLHCVCCSRCYTKKVKHLLCGHRNQLVICFFLNLFCEGSKRRWKFHWARLSGHILTWPRPRSITVTCCMVLRPTGSQETGIRGPFSPHPSFLQQTSP